MEKYCPHPEELKKMNLNQFQYLEKVKLFIDKIIKTSPEKINEEDENLLRKINDEFEKEITKKQIM